MDYDIQKRPSTRITKTDNALEDLDYKIWILFRQTRDAMIKNRERELAEVGISGIQSAVMLAINAAHDGATPAQISRWLLREPHTISALLLRMEKQGLIKCVKDLPRRNMIRVVLTNKGKKTYEFSKKRDGMHQILGELSETEKKTLIKLLRKVKDKSLETVGIHHELFPNI